MHARSPAKQMRRGRRLRPADQACSRSGVKSKSAMPKAQARGFEVHRRAPAQVHEPPREHRRHAHADQPPASTTHRQLDDAQQIAAGVLARQGRISVGLEKIDDILWDIDPSLAQAKKNERGRRDKPTSWALLRLGPKESQNSRALAGEFCRTQRRVFGDLPAVIHGTPRATGRSCATVGERTCGGACAHRGRAQRHVSVMLPEHAGDGRSA